jgi:hypothetical protein
MPLRREAREGVAFDSVFVDEAHSFNPNELAIFFLLTRRAELPPLVVAVDLPQAIGDKNYEGNGLERALLEEIETSEHVQLQRFHLDDVKRCPQPILDLVASVYTQGHNFLSPVRVPSVLTSASPLEGQKPLAFKFSTAAEMLGSVHRVAEGIVRTLRCRRSDVLIVLMHDGLDDELPRQLRSSSESLSKRMDVEAERRAQKLNHYIIGRPEFLHGLEFEAVVLVGISQNECPRLESELGQGAAALFETQRAVDMIYLALTRARQTAVLLYAGSPSFLLTNALRACSKSGRGGWAA